MVWFEILVGVATLIAAVFATLHYFKKEIEAKPVNEEKAESENIAARFFRLFDSHGIHPNQIPAFIGHNLTIADVQTEDGLINKLDETLLNYVCGLFAVRREWLDGADNIVYETHDFYKQPEKFAEFIDQLNAQKNTRELYGVLLVAKESSNTHESALIVLRQTIVLSEERVFERYYLCNNWSYNYFKSKAYLTACIAIAWKKHVHLQARYVNQTLIKQYQDGETLFEYSETYESALPLVGSLWHPEDMALKPDIYLEGVSEGQRGKVLALQLWLSLQSKGFMDTGLHYENIREEFELALAELTNGQKTSTLMSVRS